MAEQKIFILKDGKKVELSLNPSVKIVKAPPPKRTIIREETVQEILTKIPHWMIRWGNALFLGLIVLLFGLAWFIQYPEVITSEAKIISSAPSFLYTIQKEKEVKQILIEDSKKVQKGDWLIVFENQASTEDVIHLKQALNAVNINSNNFEFSMPASTPLSLGELQLDFAQFIKSYTAYESLPSHNTSHFVSLLEHFEALQSAVSRWEEKYTIKSPMDGIVQYQPMSSIVIAPASPANFIGELKLNAYNSGKIKPGQLVNIKLDNFPEREFGMLQGQIQSVRESGNPDFPFIAEVKLPQGLLTSYNITIDYSTGLVGRGDIILENKSLLKQFLAFN